MAYGFVETQDRCLLVLDLGGGTYDVSLLEVGEGVVEVKATDGDGHLGGDDFDEILLEWAHGEILRRYGFEILSRPDVTQRVREAMTAAKCALSVASSQTVELPFLYHRDGAAVGVHLSLEREDFESLCDELFERLVPPIERALERGSLRAAAIDEILLVGGATRMARVGRTARSFFGKEPSRRVDPEEAVALGAALQAGVLSGDAVLRKTLLLDAIPFSISIEVVGGAVELIIRANSTVPTRKSEIFTTSLDDQKSVEVHVLRGDRETADENQTLGRLVLEDVPSAPRGMPQIEVAVDIDANLDIRVTAQDLGTGRSAELFLSLN
jgi:molecular chaperone DnaK